MRLAWAFAAALLAVGLVAVTIDAQEVNEAEFSIGVNQVNATSNASSSGNTTTVAAPQADANQTAAAANATTTPSNDTANVTAATNATDANVTLPWYFNLSPASVPPELEWENNTEVRNFQNTIPVIGVGNDTDPNNQTAIAETLQKLKLLMDFDLPHKFKKHHDLYFKQKMWHHLLVELEKGLEYLVRCFTLRIQLRDAEKAKMKAALQSVKAALRKIKQLKQENEGLATDLKWLRHMMQLMTSRNLSQRLQIELQESSKIVTDRQAEVKKAQTDIATAKKKLQDSVKQLSAVMQRVISKFVYSGEVMAQLNPLNDEILKNGMRLLSNQIKEKSQAMTQLQMQASRQLKKALRLRGSQLLLRVKQVTHFTDEVQQQQKRVAEYTMLLNEARDRLKQFDGNSTVTPISSNGTASF